ncbi:hypothetical protein AB0I77_38465 [Streptomyces sp. NPDC050619]|uniref:hypothetical protein n=1 Tax=Streptomyces sp. NPDC050619 TaxID=3157214 RepID=UPI00342FBDE1
MTGVAREVLWSSAGGQGEPGAVTFRYDGETAGESLPTVIESLVGAPLAVQRDLVIGMRGDGTELAAQPGDFWFHTDATFLPVPPRWMVILVQEADSGGALDLLPAECLDSGPLTAPVGFRTAEGVLTAPVLEPVAGLAPGRLRYRRDRMTEAGDAGDLEKAHAAISAAAAHSTVSVGELRAGYGLLLDNWTVLHRRHAFTGRRVIRRLWLDPEDDV